MPLLMKQHFANALGPNPNSQLKCFAIQGFIDFLKVPRDSYSSMTLHACQAHRESPATLDASDGPGGGTWQLTNLWDLAWLASLCFIVFSFDLLFLRYFFGNQKCKSEYMKIYEENYQRTDESAMLQNYLNHVSSSENSKT
jgi:hypothetical protein